MLNLQVSHESISLYHLIEKQTKCLNFELWSFPTKDQVFVDWIENLFIACVNCNNCIASTYCSFNYSSCWDLWSAQKVAHFCWSLHRPTTLTVHTPWTTYSLLKTIQYHAIVNCSKCLQLPIYTVDQMVRFVYFCIDGFPALVGSTIWVIDIIFGSQVKMLQTIIWSGVMGCWTITKIFLSCSSFGVAHHQYIRKGQRTRTRDFERDILTS